MVVSIDVLAFVASVMFVAPIPVVDLIVWVLPASLIPIANVFDDVPRIFIPLNVRELTIESIVSLTYTASEFKAAVSAVVFVVRVSATPISFSLAAKLLSSKSAESASYYLDLNNGHNKK